jgi:hypothetical protein
MAPIPKHKFANGNAASKFLCNQSGANWYLQLAQCLKRGIPSFIDYSYLKEFYESSSHAMVRLTGLIHRGVDLLALWEESAAAPGFTGQTEQNSLLTQISALDVAFDGWGVALPEHAGFTTHPTPATSTQPNWLRQILEHPGMPRIAHAYASVQIIYAWNLSRMMRMLIARVLLAASLNIPSSDPTPYKETIHRMVEDISSSMLSIFTAPIDTKPYADSVLEVCGFRPYLAGLPLDIAKESLQMLPRTAEAESRIAWIEKVLHFTLKEFHQVRPT